MQGWQIFWTIWLLFAGAAFAIITVVVAIKGFGDVRRMLSGIKGKQ
jgi:hypothetical protein